LSTIAVIIAAIVLFVIVGTVIFFAFRRQIINMWNLRKKEMMEDDGKDLNAIFSNDKFGREVFDATIERDLDGTNLIFDLRDHGAFQVNEEEARLSELCNHIREMTGQLNGGPEQV
jgi:hypothetical protein